MALPALPQAFSPERPRTGHHQGAAGRTAGDQHNAQRIVNAADAETARGGARAGSRLLRFVLASLLAANPGQWLVFRLLRLGNPGSLRDDLSAFLHMRTWTDSWLPMMKSLDYFRSHPTLPIYSALIGNGENLVYMPLLYTPFVRWIYWATVAAAALLVGGVLLFPWGRVRGSAGDLAAMGLASVAASPMAWDHHYGIVCGILAWVWFSHGAAQVRRPWLLALAALLTMNGWFGLNRLAGLHGWNILQSYTYLGALLLLAVLM